MSGQKDGRWSKIVSVVAKKQQDRRLFDAVDQLRRKRLQNSKGPYARVAMSFKTCFFSNLSALMLRDPVGSIRSAVSVQ